MTDEIDELGPIDFLVIEFPPDKRAGDGLPLLLDLVDDHVIRVLDLVFMRKDSEGAVAFVTPAELEERGAGELQAFVGAASGLIGEDDLETVGEVLSPDSVGSVMIYENAWAATLASALRHGGAQLVAGGRIPIQELLAALETSHAA
jgi:hypothetical protein